MARKLDFRGRCRFRLFDWLSPKAQLVSRKPPRRHCSAGSDEETLGKTGLPWWARGDIALAVHMHCLDTGACSQRLLILQ